MRSRLRKLFGLLNRRDKRWLLVILLLMLFSSVLEVVSIGSVPLLITLVTDPVRLQGLPLVGDLAALFEGMLRTRLVIWGGTIFLLVFLARTAVMVLTRFIQFHFAATRQVRISTDLFNRYLLAPYLFHLQHNSSELIRNIQTGAMRLGGQVITQLLSVVQNVLLLLAILSLLLFAEPLVTLISLGTFGVFGALFLRLTSSRVKALGVLEMQERKSALQTLRQSLAGIREIRLLGKPAFFVQDFRSRMQNVARAQRDRQLMAFISSPLLEMLAILTLVVLTFSLLAFGRGTAETLALLGLFAVAFIRLKNSLAMVLGSYTNLNYSLVSVDPVFEGISTLGESSSNRSTKPLPLRESIEIINLGFRYPGAEKNVLEKINLSIPKGAYVGLVGTTGAGKSTLVNLLLGILPPTEGQVLVDGRDIAESLQGWQRNIGYVPQDIFLLDDTIRRNVALGMRDEAIDDDQVWRALKKAQLSEFVYSLPEGVETSVGERGVRLSGGQKQRISIARALYREPEVLILDEATASLDSETENEFLRAILALKGEMTVLSVAHRTGTLRDCNFVCSVAAGSVTRYPNRNERPVAAE